MFELTNKQRKYFGLDPIEHSWEKRILEGDKFRPESILYFEGDIIKRRIISTAETYQEIQYNEETKEKKFLLPKTAKGKVKKLSAAVLETKTPVGIYCFIDNSGRVAIASHTTSTSFYDNYSGFKKGSKKIEISQTVDNFIKESPADYLLQIDQFRLSKRKNIKYKPGDFFRFKISRTEFGFGRILLDISELRKKQLLPKNHGLFLLMGRPVLIKLYAFISDAKEVDLNLLKKTASLPSDYIFDNVLFYGQYEIIGNHELEIEEFDFPMSYGKSLDLRDGIVFFQWGLIHMEKPCIYFSKYLGLTNAGNPFGYYSLGFYPRYSSENIRDTIKKNGKFDYNSCSNYHAKYDLRNPGNANIRKDIMEAFGLDPEKNYGENAVLTKSRDILFLIRNMK